MASAKLAKELFIVTPNKVGMLDEVTGAISGAGVNIKSICAYVVDDKAFFRMLTQDNAKASAALKGKGYEVSEKEVALLGLTDKVGAAKEVAAKIKAANVDITYMYGTTCECNCECILVVNSNNNAKIMELAK